MFEAERIALLCSKAVSSIQREKTAACLWLKNRSTSLQSSLFDHTEKKELHVRSSKIAQFRSKAASPIAACSKLKKSHNFAPKQLLRACSWLKRTETASSSLREKTAACTWLKIAQLHSKAASSDPERKTATCLWLQDRSTLLQSSLFDPERKNSCMFVAERSLNFALKLSQ